MIISLREDFSGIGMLQHQEDFLHHLDRVLGELGREFRYLHQHNPSLGESDVMQMRLQYRRLRRTLLEVHGEAVATLTRESLRFIFLFRSTNPQGHVQSPTQGLRVQSLSPVRSCMIGLLSTTIVVRGRLLHPCPLRIRPLICFLSVSPPLPRVTGWKKQRLPALVVGVAFPFLLPASQRRFHPLYLELASRARDTVTDTNMPENRSNILLGYALSCGEVSVLCYFGAGSTD